MNINCEYVSKEMPFDKLKEELKRSARKTVESVSAYERILEDPKLMEADHLYSVSTAGEDNLTFMFSVEVLKALNNRPNSESISDWKNNLYAIQNGILLGTAYGTGIVRLAKNNPSIANVYEIRARGAGVGKGRRIYGFQHPKTGVFHFVKIRNLNFSLSILSKNHFWC